MPTGGYKAQIDRWEQGFAALRKFRARKGHCCPSRYHIEGKLKLGQWVITQRYYKDDLSSKRKRRLNVIGFVWDWRDHRWKQGFAALLKFRRREGHCRVPIFHCEGNCRLGWWVSTQRQNRKILSTERKARLNKIGFVWRENMGRPSVERRRAPLVIALGKPKYRDHHQIRP